MFFKIYYTQVFLAFWKRRKFIFHWFAKFYCVRKIEWTCTYVHHGIVKSVWYLSVTFGTHSRILWRSGSSCTIIERTSSKSCSFWRCGFEVGRCSAIFRLVRWVSFLEISYLWGRSWSTSVSLYEMCKRYVNRWGYRLAHLWDRLICQEFFRLLCGIFLCPIGLVRDHGQISLRTHDHGNKLARIYYRWVKAYDQSSLVG